MGYPQSSSEFQWDFPVQKPSSDLGVPPWSSLHELTVPWVFWIRPGDSFTCEAPLQARWAKKSKRKKKPKREDRTEEQKVSLGPGGKRRVFFRMARCESILGYFAVSRCVERWAQFKGV